MEAGGAGGFGSQGAVTVGGGPTVRRSRRVQAVAAAAVAEEVRHIRLRGRELTTVH